MPRKGKRRTISRGIYEDSGGYEVRVTVGSQSYSARMPKHATLEELKRKRAQLDAQGRTETPRLDRAAIDVKHLPRSLDGWCYVYFAQAGAAVKIGRSVNPAQRVAELQTTHPEEIAIVATVATHASLEAAIHDRYQHLRTRETGEWFRLEPDLVAFIRAIQQGANPVALLFGDPAAIVEWYLPRPGPCPEN
jgi:Meiotically Up-regulated Gene 113 (MUG113) protein